MRALAGVAIAVALAGCASQDAPQAPPASPPPAAAPAGPPSKASPVPAPKDACGAAEVQALIGHPRTDVPVPLHPDRQRVACTTCPVTQDYRPERLNFFFDAQTGLIREIRCG